MRTCSFPDLKTSTEHQRVTNEKGNEFTQGDMTIYNMTAGL